MLTIQQFDTGLFNNPGISHNGDPFIVGDDTLTLCEGATPLTRISGTVDAEACCPIAYDQVISRGATPSGAMLLRFASLTLTSSQQGLSHASAP
jgi:hypothetical protein